LGGSHERRQRAGTENVPGIVGLARATELAMLSLEDETIPRLAALRDRLEAEILRIPGTGVNGSLIPQLLGAPSLPRTCFCGKGGIPQNPTGHVFENGCTPVPRVANTTNIFFDQLEGEALVIALDLKGVSVSGGSACHSGATEPSHVLMAMGLNKTRARASLRFSLLKTATDADVDHILQVVPEAVEHLRALSPVAAGTLG
jgi:cysteine desulfurase